MRPHGATIKDQATRRAGRQASAFLTFLFLALSIRTWRRLGDPMVDFGREVYMAWRVAEGARVGQDVIPLFGSLPIHVNAAIWSAGGGSMTPILLANVGVAGLAAAAMFRTSRELFRVSTSVLLTAVFLVTCAFAQLRPFGSFNFAAPYSHAATYGALLAFTSLALLVGHARRPSLVRLAAGSFSAGVTWLLKPEVAVAATAGVVVAVLVSPRRGRRELAAAAAILLPSAGFLAVGTLVGDASNAVASLIRPWLYSLTVPTRAAGYYALVSGLHAPGASLGTGLSLATLAGCGVAGLVVLDLATAGERHGARVGLGLALFALTLVSLFVTSAWLGLGPALPHLLAFAIGVLGWERWGRRSSPDSADRNRSGALLVWAVVAVALLGKVLLRTRLDHYGFYLAAPGLLLLFGLLLEEIPRRVRQRHSAAGLVTVLGVLGISAAVIAGSLRITEHWLTRKTTWLGSDGDRLYVLDGSVDPRARPVRDAIRLSRKRAEPDESVLVVPEGGIVNYLARRRSPIPTSSLLPPEIAAVGSDRLLESLVEDPPALVFVSPLPLADYGDKSPGNDPSFGAEIMRWIDERYAVWISLSDVASAGVRHELRVLRPRGGPEAQ